MYLRLNESAELRIVLSTVFHFQDWLVDYSKRTEVALERLLDSADTTPERLHQAMRYAAQGGGKAGWQALLFAHG